ncbi:MAG: class I SAM-dependent methyltransferase [Anaerolineae bacterium]
MRLVRRGYDAQYFDSFADRIPLYRDVIASRMATVVRQVASGGRLLELGCGDGRLLALLARDFEVTGIDISEFAIARARRRIPEANLLVGDVAVCTQDCRYEVVLALNLLEHLPDPAAVMMRVSEMLEENGKFIFAVPNKYGVVGKTLVALMNKMDRTHISTYTRERWLELAGELGFGQIRVLNATWFGPSRHNLARHLAPIVIVLLYKKPLEHPPADQAPGDAIDVAMALARHPELITSMYE